MDASKRFKEIELDNVSADKKETLERMFIGIEAFAKEFLLDSRPKSLFLTALEETHMWAKKAIAEDQRGRAK